MKSAITFVITVLLTQFSFSQTMTVHKTDQTTTTFQLLQIDSITFSIGSGTIPTQGLVAWYPFNGNAHDSSGNSNNGTNNGATPDTDRFGNANMAYSFNGSSSYVEVPNSPSLNSSNAITISAWIYPRVWLGGSRVLEKGNGDTQYMLYSNPAAFHFYLYNVTNGDLPTPQPSLNQWHHVVATFDSSTHTQQMWIDGVIAVDSIHVSGGIHVTNYDLYIGWKPVGAAGDHWEGKLNDIRIYNRALSSTEILSLYHENGW